MLGFRGWWAGVSAGASGEIIGRWVWWGVGSMDVGVGVVSIDIWISDGGWGAVGGTQDAREAFVLLGAKVA